MNEQINEMAKILKDYTKKNHIMASHVILEDYAEQLYNAGYRKQKEGEWIVVYEYNDYRMCKEAKIACSVCGHKPKYDGYLSDMNFCPKCGASMEGAENG